LKWDRDVVVDQLSQTSLSQNGGDKVKCLFILLLLASIIAVLSAEPQGLYFDFGGGLGTAYNNFIIVHETTKNDLDYTKETYYPTYPSGLGFDISTRIGYGPFDYPLFLLGEVAWIKSNSFTEESVSEDNTSKTTTELYHIFAGPGVAYYPIKELQVSTSAGIVFSQLNIKRTKEYANYELGYGFNISAAVDLSSETYTGGLLVGAKFSYSNTRDIDISAKSDDYSYKYSPATTYVGIFLKYRSKE